MAPFYLVTLTLRKWNPNLWVRLGSSNLGWASEKTERSEVFEQAVGAR